MADSIQSPETGGGEGAAPPTSPPQVQQDPKPVEIQQNVANNVAQTQESLAAKPEESKPEKPNPETPKLEELNPEASKPEEPKQEEPKPEEPKAEELKSEVLKPEATKADESKQSDERTAAGQNANKVEQNNAAPKETEWQQRETELLKKIGELEKTKCEKTEDGLKLQLKVREEEIDLLKARVKNLETELQAALSKPNGKNHEMIENIKQQHEELLSKARGMIFDKTKMVKNQELQIEALNTQVQSLKDINQITKDLLQIRNGEIKAMEDRLEAMEARFKVEKERYSLVLQRAQTSTTINDDLKKEYETQLAIFKELREKYELRVKALVAENEKLKGGDSAKGGPSA